jgi:hypothetical protein
MRDKFTLSFLLWALLLLYPWPIQAQEVSPEMAVDSSPATYALGFKGGQDYFRVNFEPTFQQNLTQGYTAGIVFKYLSLPRAGLQVELNYTQRGWSAAADTSRSRQWQYLELPLLTHVVLGKRRSSFILTFGPWLSYLLSPADTITLVTENFNRQAGFSNVPHSLVYGLSFGIGYSLKTPVGRFQLEGRLSHGLSNALKGSFFTTSQYQVLGLNLIYFIEKRKSK